MFLVKICFIVCLFIVSKSAFLFAGNIPVHAKPENVLVIVNDASSESKEIGAYYQSKRKIPSVNMMHYTGPTTEVVTETDYANLVTAIKNWIAGNNLQSKIDYLVQTKGTPYRNKDMYGDMLSSRLALISTTVDKKTKNPYASRDGHWYGNTGKDRIEETFSHQKIFGGYNLYLVTRLDGYTVDDVKRLIDIQHRYLSERLKNGTYGKR